MLFFVNYYWMELNDITNYWMKNSCLCSVLESLSTIAKKKDNNLFLLPVLKCILNSSFLKIQSIRSIPRDIRIARSNAIWHKQDFGKFESAYWIRGKIRKVYGGNSNVDIQ